MSYLLAWHMTQAILTLTFKGLWLLSYNHPSFVTQLCLSRATAVVVVAFAAAGDMRILLEELARKPSPPRQWIGSEAWVTDSDMLRFNVCTGAIGIGIQRSVIPGLRDFLLDLSPAKVAASPVLTEFWEDAFNCRLQESEKVEVLFFLYFWDFFNLFIKKRAGRFLVFGVIYLFLHNLKMNRKVITKIKCAGRDIGIAKITVNQMSCTKKHMKITIKNRHKITFYVHSVHCRFCINQMRKGIP